MHAISVKELRTKFPFIRSELKKGETFLLIHKSVPFGIIKPVTKLQLQDDEDDDFKEWERASIEDMNKHLPPLTKEEYNYYMSLAPKKK